jgi:hypothetical protein
MDVERKTSVPENDQQYGKTGTKQQKIMLDGCFVINPSWARHVPKRKKSHHVSIVALITVIQQSMSYVFNLRVAL